MKTKLQQTYENIPERIILMALESVDYSEDKAIQILNIVVEDDNKKINEKKNEDSDVSGSTVNETKYVFDSRTLETQFFKASKIW